MKTYIITDTHFDHKNIEKWTNRKKGWQERLYRNFVDTVNPEDTVIHLGDIAFKNDEKWNVALTTISNHNILIKGNHDQKSYSWYLKFWDCVCERMDLYMYGQNIVLSHKPVRIYENQINLHGHFHNAGLEKAFYIEPDLGRLYTPNHCLVKLEGINNVQNMEKLVRKFINKKGKQK